MNILAKYTDVCYNIYTVYIPYINYTNLQGVLHVYSELHSN